MLSLALLEREGEGSRARIMQVLRERPGLNKTQLCRLVGLSWATTTYHLRRLQVQGAVELERRGRRDVRCFPVAVPAKYRPWLAALLDASSSQILETIS